MAHFDESDDFNYEAQSSESHDAKEIGRRIKLARKARRISQKELAEMLNRSLRTIQKYESGDIEVSVAALVSVCQALRVPLSYLVGLGTRKALITSLADVMDFLFMLEKVKELHFAIEVEKPPKDRDWRCSVSFSGTGTNAKHNAALCLLLEQWQDQREKLAADKITDKDYSDWKDQTISYCSFERIEPVGSKNSDPMGRPSDEASEETNVLSGDEMAALRNLLSK